MFGDPRAADRVPARLTASATKARIAPDIVMGDAFAYALGVGVGDKVT